VPENFFNDPTHVLGDWSAFDDLNLIPNLAIKFIVYHHALAAVDHFLIQWVAVCP
jgi:hypothetical protein